MAQKKQMHYLKFKCPRCGEVLRTSTKSRGRLVQCPGCETRIKIPQLAGSKQPMHLGRDANQGVDTEVEMVSPSGVLAAGRFLLFAFLFVAYALLGTMVGGFVAPLLLFFVTYPEAPEPYVQFFSYALGMLGGFGYWSRLFYLARQKHPGVFCWADLTVCLFAAVLLHVFVNTI